MILAASAILALVQAPPPAAAVAAAPSIRALYDWGYVGADGEGKGTLSVLLELEKGHVVMELHGLGERLVLLQGDAESGYRLQIPRQKVDRVVKALDELPVPFLPKLGTPEALGRLLERGDGPGVKATDKDALGPRKLRYQGKDEKGNDLMVWLTRTRWERPSPDGAVPR